MMLPKTSRVNTVDNHHPCRHCGNRLNHSFLDLGTSPLANSYLKPHQLSEMEPFYPLHAYVCDECYLVQLPECTSPETLFSEYAYFSSYSASWLKHAKDYTERMVERFGFDRNSQVVEIASNDGYLLQYFKEKNIPVLGFEPAKNVAEAARSLGISTIISFFNSQTARGLAAKGKRADLLIGNNVLAHVPDVNDFVKGLKILLRPRGIITMEFPHLMRLIEENQFDTIYHEHYSYFSFITVNRIFSAYGLKIFDVEELPTHGGSLRIYARHVEDVERETEGQVRKLLEREEEDGFTNMEFYSSFNERVKETKKSILEFMIEQKRQGKSMAGYGAPAKGNTLLNYCGIRSDFIDYTVDLNPHKQGQYLPGVRIPIYAPDKIAETKPDYMIILPWNLKDEIMKQMSHIRQWGGKFTVLIPEVKVYA